MSKNPKILPLTLTKCWFDMIRSGEKKEEYRELKAYWITRLMTCNEPKEHPDDNKHFAANMDFDIKNGHSPRAVAEAYWAQFKPFDVVRFTNGYGKNAPTFDIECESIEIAQGWESWGAKLGTFYFVIKLGNIIQ